MSKKRFNDALRLIISNKVPTEEELQIQQFIDINQDAFDMYGRIHKRFIYTPAGFAKVY